MDVKSVWHAISELFNTFDEIHYFIAGVCVGFIGGFVFAVKYLEKIHKYFFSRKQKPRKN